jgi:hypothetical protein
VKATTVVKQLQPWQARNCATRHPPMTRDITTRGVTPKAVLRSVDSLETTMNVFEIRDRDQWNQIGLRFPEYHTRQAWELSDFQREDCRLS